MAALGSTLRVSIVFLNMAFLAKNCNKIKDIAGAILLDFPQSDFQLDSDGSSQRSKTLTIKMTTVDFLSYSINVSHVNIVHCHVACGAVSKFYICMLQSFLYMESRDSPFLFVEPNDLFNPTSLTCYSFKCMTYLCSVQQVRYLTIWFKPQLQRTLVFMFGKFSYSCIWLVLY